MWQNTAELIYVLPSEQIEIAIRSDQDRHEVILSGLPGLTDIENRRGQEAEAA